MSSRKHHGYVAGCAAAGAAALILVAGCNGTRASAKVGGYAPSLEDAPLNQRGGANPNAPYAMLSPVKQLARRTALVDSTLAEACTAAQLSAYESGASVEGERRTVRVSLVNHGDAPCKLSGVPAVSLVGADGMPLAQVVVQTAAGAVPVQEGAEPTAVVLPARGESEFSIQWTAGANCAAVASIAVAAPGTTRSYLVPHPLNVCGDRITVSAVAGPGAL